MECKNELLELIEKLSEEQMTQTNTFLKKLISNDQENETVSEQVKTLDPLDTFMATIVNSLTNTMYDLSLDAKRKEEKVMEKRLESYRKKISDGWNIYMKSKDKS
jgi:predicted nuclease with TOPRIM domain